ncbi:M23 family metallopeptidase [Candidatus Parcubacteria bacterium]|nr:M23 family metallopeptidase [Candidatus Parcubacteria bacterium]
MKRPLLLAIPIVVALALVVKHESLRPVTTPQIPDTGLTATATGANTVASVTMSVLPKVVLQGDPALIAIDGIDNASAVKSLVWNGKPIGVLMLHGKPSAFVGVDLRMKPGTYPITLTLNDGRVVKKDLVVGTREIAKAPLGIPESLGGNTPEAEKQLVSELAKENAIISSVPTSSSALWSEDFVFPLKGELVITDPYGYTRLTGASTISHKGTDFRAATGTPVYAMNSGTVRIARNFTDYGGTIILDHGLGLQTLYMHLSELDVKVGDTVVAGELIGKSGQTGYAEAPHLHISVKIGGVSIDPMKFMKLGSL